MDVDGVVALTNTGLIKSLNSFSDAPGGASEGVLVGGGNITNSGVVDDNVGGNNFHASYEGDDGNDLTLTVAL